MVKRKDFLLLTRDNLEMAVYHWPAEVKAKAVIIILHGMAEHAQRYENYAQALSGNGYAVYACDHRGHGMTGTKSGRLGFFANEDGWMHVVSDIMELVKMVKKDNPGLPLFLYGHSMGSFLARTCMTISSEKFTGIILTGTSVEKLLTIRLGQVLSSLQILFQGLFKNASFLDFLSFGSFNRSFRPNRTQFDWLSRDNAEVDAYIKDPLCGFVCSLGFFRDLFTGLHIINNEKNLHSVQAKPAVLILSGSNDPVSHKGQDTHLLANTYLRIGFNDVLSKVYDGARHELQHEINKDEVLADIISWLDLHTKNN